MNLKLIPYPKKVEIFDEKLYLGGLDIVLSPMCDTRIFKAAKTFKAELESETEVESRIVKAFCTKCGKNIAINVTADEDSEAYIQFENVDFSAALYVNGVDCGTAAFAPYIYKVKLKKGVNRLKLKVSGTAGNEFRRCFWEELEPAGYFNGYSKRFTQYKINDDKCGVSQRAILIKERKNK
jgi:hypothetical protein